MDSLITLLIPALVAVILVRLLLLPLRGILKIAIHSGCGFLCLWLLNTVSSVTGIAFPINAVTVVIAGFLGLPGIGLLAVLAVL
ncbi:MAG: pro-sigmaK processing inhibitor BofA family protein [Oscillospiraceae bacterium]